MGCVNSVEGQPEDNKGKQKGAKQGEQKAPPAATAHPPATTAQSQVAHQAQATQQTPANPSAAANKPVDGSRGGGAAVVVKSSGGGAAASKPRNDNVLDAVTQHELASSLILTELFKKLVGTVISRQKSLWQMWNELDKKEEAELVKNHENYENLKATFSQIVKAELKKDVESNRYVPDASLSYFEQVRRRIVYLEQLLLERKELGKSMYGTVQFEIAALDILRDQDALTDQWVTTMIEEVKKNKIISYHNVLQILKRVLPELTKLDNVQMLTIPEGTRLTVVGDIHGQLDDLLTILQMNGRPSESNRYLFNGDFVDRGTNSVECVLLLFALKALFPNGVHLNRGNHESRDMNCVDGFERECLEKYDKHLFDAFSEVFGALPLAAVIENTVFVVHAGLTWTDVTIDDIQREDRFHPIPIHDSIAQQLLWSDPCHENGRYESQRGAGLSFGPDVARTFCQNNGFNFIIRSHECVDDGYEMWFDNTFVTIFSASNYCGDTGNLGAFLTYLSARDMIPRITTYNASSTLKPKSQRNNTLEATITKKLMSRITDKRVELSQAFRDVSKDGQHVSRVQWSMALNKVLGLDIPFLQLARALGITALKVGEKVDFHAFLRLYRPHHKQLHGDEKEGEEEKNSLMDFLFNKRNELEALFRYFDEDKNGSVSLQEFRNGVMSLMDNLGVSFPLSEINSAMAAIDANGDGEIEVSEFLQAFSFDHGVNLKLQKQSYRGEGATKMGQKEVR